LRLFCVYIEVLWRADHLSKESYQLCIQLENWKVAKAQQRATEP
jgi:hypothetical protein